MRITGGQFRGRNLRTPKSGVRPTQDMVRQAIFNILMGRIINARFLDLYAGSGAIGLEALSRGADDVTWVESSRPTLATLKANLSDLETQIPDTASSHIVADDVMRFLKRAAHRHTYDIIFADPPYADARAGEEDPLHDMLQLIQDGALLTTDGVFVYESAGGRRAPKDDTLPEGWQPLTDREYGRTRIRVFTPA